ncbi:MAG TPA: septal ring lytic transglycosylase RlpA family protein [Thermoanaerobaculia bacterium]|nr:septal ring lytic transglycosylase RlpA family protein [Thermoanaerobaculia bacterium]
MDHTALPTRATSPTRSSCKLNAAGRAQHRPAPPGRAFSLSGTRRSLPFLSLLVPLLLPILTTGCSSAHPRLRPSQPGPTGPVERGMASWYGPGFDGHRTASGQRYRRTELTAAHRTLPFGTRVQVRNLENGASVVVKINDRGPFSRGRVIDLSYEAARQLGVSGPGTAQVEIAVLGTEGDVPPETHYSYTVQVGAYSDPDLAVLLHRDLKRLYPEAYVHSDGTWNRVQVGLFTDRENAESLRRELAAMGMPALVVAAAH